jgi:glycosyltransferase involved in cell wall biosynthesis
MKVTMVSPVFPFPNAGAWPGIERWVGELSRALVKAGADVSVLTTFWNGGSEEDSWEGVRICRVPDARQRWGKAGLIAGWNVRSFSRNILRHRDLLRSSDVIHSFVGLSSRRELANLGVPLFASFPHRDRASGLSETVVQLGRFRRDRRFFQRTNTVFTGSEAARRVLIGEYGLDAGRVHVVHLGVDGERFIPPGKTRPGDPAREREEGVRLLYMGPFLRRKGLHTLVKSLPRIRDAGVSFKLFLVGEGPEENQLRALASELGVSDRISFEGFARGARVIDWYQQADLFVFPSTLEGFGLVLVEAMACGLPVITTEVAPMPEVVGEAGETVPPSDPRALAGAIIGLARDAARRQDLGRRGRRRVEEKFLWRRVAEQTLGHYGRACGHAGEVA